MAYVCSVTCALNVAMIMIYDKMPLIQKLLKASII